MLTAYNQFHILVLHLKKHLIEKKNNLLLCTFNGLLPKLQFGKPGVG